ncbi:unnamed protein product [Choristocarpus tenellus]
MYDIPQTILKIAGMTRTFCYSQRSCGIPLLPRPLGLERLKWTGRQQYQLQCSLQVDETSFKMSSRRTFVGNTIATVAGVLTASLPRDVWSLESQRDASKAQPPPQALLLPVTRIKVAAEKLQELLNNPSNWKEAQTLLQSPYFVPGEFRAVLDRYSDSNWGTHILGDLYRNQGLESIKAMDELLAYMLQQIAKGGEITAEDVEDVVESGRALAASLDAFLALAPPGDAQIVDKLARMEGGIK